MLPRTSCQPPGSRHSDEARAGLYSQGEQRSGINLAFQRYFQALGKVLFQELENSRAPEQQKLLSGYNARD